MITFCVPIFHVLYSEHILHSTSFFFKLNIVDLQYCVSFRYTQQGNLLTHMKVKMLVTQLCPTSVTPWTVAARLLSPWNSPGKNTGVGYHFLLQGIFPTQGSNPGPLHCRQILYHLSHKGSLGKYLYYYYFFNSFPLQVTARYFTFTFVKQVKKYASYTVFQGGQRELKWRMWGRSLSGGGLIGNYFVTYLLPFVWIREDRISVYKWHNVDASTLAWETPSVLFLFILCVCVCI